MVSLPTGDLARHITLRNQMMQTKTALLRHANEMASQRTSDVGNRLRGDYNALAAIERDIAKLASYRTSATEADLMARGAQTTLDLVQTASTDVAALMLSLGSLGNQTGVAAVILEAHDRFHSVVSALNMQVGGRTLFGGTATDSPAILPAADILEALRDELVGATSAQEYEQAVRGWLEAGNAYIGSDESLAPFALSETETATLQVRADNPAITEFLVGMALGALIGEGALPDSPSQQTALSLRAGEILMGLQGPLSSLRSEVGLVEARIEGAITKIGAQTAVLGEARQALIGVDPFDAATELDAVQTQLETLYAITARMSGLSLVNFLR
ncbi:flagellin [Halodurantibacterium flavum]|uniref:Flagellin n=1 Tax=Halodurantibacterium flavum TaxID=1382802 RepID=A0ABW4S7R5_9RHOB